jgi:HAD superfamily hydrolase (TIGR01509 family)
VFPATLFDFNGVLVDDEHVHLASFREVLAPLGIEVSDQEYMQRYIGFDDAGAFRAMLQDHGRDASDADVTRLVTNKRPVYLRHAEAGLTVFPGAAELVRRTRKHGRVGIVSGALRHEIELGLETLGVKQEIEFVISAEDAKRSKPDPEGYLLARSRLGSLAAVVIEDSPAGVKAAKAAGLSCIAVMHSATREQLEAAGADAIFERVGDIRDAELAELARQVHG